jgi:predicted GNAT family acetyltransferase
MDKQFTHEPENKRYVLRIDGQITAVADYSILGEAISFHHTYTAPPQRGKGFAGEIVEFAVNDVEKNTDFHIVPMCWYVDQWFQEHPDRSGLLTR